MHRLAGPVFIAVLAWGAFARGSDDALAAGDAARAKKDYQAALDAYSQAVAQHPHDPRAYILRGSMRAKLGDNTGAIADDNAALALDPKDVVALTNRGNARAAMRDFTGAKTDYAQAIALDPKHASAWLNRGNVENEQGDEKAALADYDRAVDLDAKNPLAFYDRAGARRAMGDAGGAIADYSRAITLAPGDVRAYLNRAVLRMARRDWKNARSDLRQCLQLTPLHAQPWPRIYLWVIGIQQGDEPRATAALARYLNNGEAQAFADAWPWQVARFCAGQTDEAAFLSAATAAQAKRDRGQAAQADFYAGLRRDLAGRHADALDFFRRCAGSGDAKLHEIFLAREAVREAKDGTP